MQDALDLQVLDGAQVYWRELRRFYVNKKSSNKQEQVIIAAVLGLKHCKYIYGGINTICTLELQTIDDEIRVVARPINKKLPHLQIIDMNGFPMTL